MALRTNNYELLLAASLVAGLLVSFHCGIADMVVLLPAFVLVIRMSDYSPFRSLTALALTPIPYFMTLADAPYGAALPCLLVVLLVMASVALRKKNDGAVTSGRDTQVCRQFESVRR